MGTKEGIWMTRTVRRKTFEDRWRRENLELVGGVPWRMLRNEAGEGDELKNDVVIMDKDYRERLRKEEVEAVPRNVYIRKEDCEMFGVKCINVLFAPIAVCWVLVTLLPSRILPGRGGAIAVLVAWTFGVWCRRLSPRPLATCGLRIVTTATTLDKDV